MPRPVTEQAPPPFILIEDVALPLTLSVMEAQPIAMGIALLTLLSGSTLARAPLGIGELAVLLLGLLWWAMLLAALKARGHLRSAFLQTLLRLGSLLVVWGIVAFPQLAELGDGAHVIVLVGELLLILWLWQRSCGRARLGFAYEPLARSFRVGLGVLLAVILLALVIQPALVLLPMLEASLTIFFLSGLVTLSLGRLGVIRQVRTVNGKQADPTRSWVGALLLLSGGLIGVVFALEAVFSYASFLWILSALQPVWNGLGTVIGWVLYALLFLFLTPLFDGLSWLIGLVRGHGHRQPQTPPVLSSFTHLTQTQHAAQLPPELLQIGRWVVLGLVGLLVLALVRASLRRWFLPYAAEKLEETREPVERLPRAPTTRRSRSQPRHLIEPLESARAFYRLFLHTLADARQELARQPSETPLEYEQRLHQEGESLDTGSANEQDAAVFAPQDALTLETLTQAYMAERYGHQPLDAHQHASLRQQMPHLLHTLTRTPASEHHGRKT